MHTLQILQAFLILWSSFGVLIFGATITSHEKNKEANIYQTIFLFIIYGPIIWCLILGLLIMGGGIALYEWLGKLTK